jgi:hypothetical protein
MKRRLAKIAFLLWLGCYLAGPLAETFDSWDPPREELRDVQRNAGGAITMVAAVFCLIALLFRRWRDRALFAAKALTSQIVSLRAGVPMSSSTVPPAFSHSPPLLLRI